MRFRVGPAPAVRAESTAPSPIRVCFLIDRLNNAGTESQLLALLRHLDRTRVQPYLCLLDGEDAISRSLEPADCPVLRFGIRSLHHLWTFRQAARFASFLRQERIDVLQVYFPDSTYFGVPLAYIAGVSRVVGTRFNLGYSLTPFQRWMNRLYGPALHARVTNCAACRDAVVADEWANPANVWVLENGVEVPDVPPLTTTRPVRRVGLVGNLRPIKDPETFVRAAKLVTDRFPDAQFAIAGEGELRPALEQLIADLDLRGRVVLKGVVKDVPEFLGQVDIGVSSSRSEGLSNAVLEYMAAGRAVVATAVGGTPQLIDHGEQGLLVAPGSPSQLAAAIGELMAEPANAVRMAAAARQRVRDRYGMALRGRRFEAFYAQILGRSLPSPIED